MVVFGSGSERTTFLQHFAGVVDREILESVTVMGGILRIHCLVSFDLLIFVFFRRVTCLA